MGPFVIGPISTDAFLKSFLPPPLVPLASPFVVGMFIPLVNMLSKPETESKYYKVFVSSDPHQQKKKRVYKINNDNKKTKKDNPVNNVPFIKCQQYHVELE